MLNIQTISTRDVVRNYKAVFARVRKTRQPAIVLSQKQPQVAIISMDDLYALQEHKSCQSARALLNLAGIIPEGSGLPADLSKNHSHYAWD